MVLPDRIPSAAAQPSGGPVQSPEVIRSGTRSRAISSRSSGVALRTFSRGGDGVEAVVAHPAASIERSPRARILLRHMSSSLVLRQLQIQYPSGLAKQRGWE